jgi:hypothetical protein
MADVAMRNIAPMSVDRMLALIRVSGGVTDAVCAPSLSLEEGSSAMGELPGVGDVGVRMLAIVEQLAQHP